MNHKLAKTALIILFKLIQVKASVRYFWHVSDFHLDPRYGSNISDGRSLRDIFLGDYDEGCWTERRNPIGDYNCDSPLALVQEFVTDFLAKSYLYAQTSFHSPPGQTKTRKSDDIKSVRHTIHEKCHGGKLRH